MEKGSIILIGATTENPSFEINGALLSRCKVFVLQQLTREDIVGLLERDHDLTLRELRGYFTWRKEIRKGNYRVAGNTMAMIYLYELVNGIGTASPEESLQKMREFEEHYINMVHPKGRILCN